LSRGSVSYVQERGKPDTAGKPNHRPAIMLPRNNEDYDNSQIWGKKSAFQNLSGRKVVLYDGEVRKDFECKSTMSA